MKGRYMDVACTYCSAPLEPVTSDNGKSRYERREVAKCPKHGRFLLVVSLSPLDHTDGRRPPKKVA